MSEILDGHKDVLTTKTFSLLTIILTDPDMVTIVNAISRNLRVHSTVDE